MWGEQTASLARLTSLRNKAGRQHPIFRVPISSESGILANPPAIIAQ
jgi:hypothetical protein